MEMWRTAVVAPTLQWPVATSHWMVRAITDPLPIVIVALIILVVVGVVVCVWAAIIQQVLTHWVQHLLLLLP